VVVRREKTAPEEKPTLRESRAVINLGGSFYLMKFNQPNMGFPVKKIRRIRKSMSESQSLKKKSMGISKRNN